MPSCVGISITFIISLLGTWAAQSQAAFGGKLTVTPEKAVVYEQTDGWLGKPDLFVRVRAYTASNNTVTMSSSVVEVGVKVDAVFMEPLKFEGRGPWKKLDVTVIDRDKGEYGEGKDDVVVGPIPIELKSNKGEEKLADGHGAVLFKWSIK